MGCTASDKKKYLNMKKTHEGYADTELWSIKRPDHGARSEVLAHDRRRAQRTDPEEKEQKQDTRRQVRPYELGASSTNRKVKQGRRGGYYKVRPVY